MTLSQEALTLSSSSNILVAAASSDAGPAASQGATPVTGSPVQQLAEQGYLIAQIAFELSMSLTEVEVDLGIETFSIAA